MKLVFLVMFWSLSLFAKDWLFFVFLNADNSLSSYAEPNIKQMEKVGATDKLDIVLVYDNRKNGDTKYCVFKDKCRNCVSVGELDMGSAATLQEWLLKAINDTQPEHIALVLWDHGSGWKKRSIQRPTIDRGISYDDTSNTYITTWDLGIALDNVSKTIGKKLDIVSYDACLMQMVEVTYELKNSADYIVGSEDTELAEGWDYSTSLASFLKGTSIEPLDFAFDLVNAYNNLYSSDATMSVLDTSKLDDFASFWKDFTISLTKDDYNKARKAAQYFTYSSHVDVGSFLSNLNIVVPDFDKLIPLTYGGSGLAVWAPSSFSQEYMKLKWAQDTGWGAKLDEFTKIE